jgi:hypothetical protein
MLVRLPMPCPCSGSRRRAGLLVALGHMQQAPNTTTTNASGILEVLATYFEAFAEYDAGRRIELLSCCLTPDGAIWGHSRVFAGYAAISEKIAGFHNNWPDCRLVLASGLFAFENIVRFGNAIVRADGSVLTSGETVMEIAHDGRICRVVPLWEMTLPPLPGSWPEDFAVPPPPKAHNAA